MNILRNALVALTLSAFASTSAFADVYLWSQTPSANTNSDIADDINWLEGMPPSEVNNSARAMMSEVRKWIDDMGASIPASTLMTTGGTANVQTLTTNGASSALTHGWKVCFHVGAGLTPTGATTLNVDSLGAIAVQGLNGTALSGGEMAANTIQCAVYDSNDAVWQLVSHQPIDQASIVYSATGEIERAALTGDVAATVGSNATVIQPAAVEPAMLDTDVYTKAVGEVFDFAGATCPAKSTEADGGELNRTTHSDLFAVISTVYGIGDGSLTYNIPDARDRVIVGLGDMGSGDAARIGNYATLQGSTGGEDEHTMIEAELAAHDHGITGPSGSNNVGHDHSISITSGSNNVGHTHTWSDTSNTTGSHTHTDQRAIASGASSGTNNIRYVANTTNTGAAGNHAHSVSGTTSGVSANHTHLVSGTSGAESVTHTHTLPAATDSTGSATPFNVVQPFIAMQKCIFVGDQL